MRLYSTRNGIAKRIAGRNFIEIGFNATRFRAIPSLDGTWMGKNDVQWRNDFTFIVLDLERAVTWKPATPPSRGRLSQFIFVHQRTFNVPLFQDVFTYPRDLLATHCGPPSVPPLWPANYRHGSRVFLKRRYPLREIPISTVCFPLSPHRGWRGPRREMEFLKDQSRLDATSKRLAVTRAFWFRDQPWRVSREIAPRWGEFRWSFIEGVSVIDGRRCSWN